VGPQARQSPRRLPLAPCASGSPFPGSIEWVSRHDRQRDRSSRSLRREAVIDADGHGRQRDRSFRSLRREAVIDAQRNRRQRDRTTLTGPNLLRRAGLILLELRDVTLHLQAGQPFDVARKVNLGLQALRLVGGRKGGPVLGKLVAGLLLRVEADLEVVRAVGAAHQSDHYAGAQPAGLLDVEYRPLGD